MTPRRRKHLSALFVGLSFFLGLLSAQAEVLSDLQTTSINARLGREKSAGEMLYRLKLSPRNANQVSADFNAEVFAIQDPVRLVVDVPNFSSKKSITRDIDDPALSAIRVGIHPNKVRLVIDVKLSEEPLFLVSSDPGASVVFVDFRFGGTAPSEPVANVEIDPVPTPTAEPTVEPEETPTPLPQETVSLTPEPSPTPEVEPSPEPIAETPPPVVTEPSPPPAPEPEETVLKMISFRSPKNSKSSAVALDFEGLNNYSFRKKQKNIYELVIENAKLIGTHIGLPHFPPDEFEGFEVVHSEQRGENIVIKVFVNEGTSITPFRAKGVLWLKASD